MREEARKTVKCAVYTRKSTEDGLEQDFNSLDAQREACEAYIKSQQHEGWILVEKHYNDGGFSGGTLERPAIKDLFKDIEAGEVDIVVVYKVDRLTRSLMDFSKIVELFDKHQASFVSITQSFNTTTSMGRLTLNMLLSFAQFEREVTGERIRDKIAASKKKGMWMGGIIPMGYQRIDKKLLIESEWANIVRLIFRKYLELKSVCKLKTHLQDNNIKAKSGATFSKGSLYYILANKTYIGLICHKEKVYGGEHEAIIDNETFEETQKLLLKNRVDKNCNTKSTSNSLLAGKFYDDKGNRMSPTHSRTRKLNYRYYISQAVVQQEKEREGSVSKIPAGEIEKFVIDTMKDFLLDTRGLQCYLKHFDISKQKAVLKSVENINDFSDPSLIRAILDKVIISKDSVKIILCEKALLGTLENLYKNVDPPEETKNEAKFPIVILKKVEITRTSHSGNILIINSDEKLRPTPNPYLVRAIVKSHYWNKLLLEGKAKDSIDIQKMEGLSDNTYVKDILKLRFLPPNLTEEILNGTQSSDLTVQKLFKNN